MERNLEEEITIPSPIKIIEDSSMKNPLFQDALRQIEDPRKRESFLRIFRNYLLEAYNNNPRMNRLMKAHDITNKLDNSPEDSLYDERSILDEQLYSEPGRAYQYSNSILGKERKKKGLLKRAYNTTKDFTFETLPGIVGLGGWYGTKKWYTKRMAQEAAEGGLAKIVGKKALKGFGGAFENMKWYEYNPLSAALRLSNGLSRGARAAAGATVKETASDSLLGIVGAALNPAKYLLGGYFLYKTIKYFMKKYKEKKELNELNRNVWLQNQMLAQRI